MATHTCVVFVLVFFTVSLISVVSSKTCDITTYGAKGDNATDNTKAIQAAIDDCLSGGTVVVPDGGVFMSYPITVNKGNGFTFMVEPKATLRAGDISKWPVLGNDYVNFFTMTGCSNCKMTGGGLVDGGGTPWYILFDEKKLLHSRPNLIVIEDSTDFSMITFNILNSPQFNVILRKVVGAEIAYVNIKDEWYAGGTKEPHNTDGIDPGSDSKNIHIHDVVIDNGDDSVAIKPGTVAGGCTSNILVENCQFTRGHGASIGSIGSGCIQDITFRNITITSQEAGCRIKAYSSGAGFVKNIVWEDIRITNTDACVSINTNYNTLDKLESSLASVVISNITFSGITGTGCTIPGEFICQSSQPCTGIHLININTAQNAKTDKMTCTAAHGTATNVQPPSCLLS